MSNNTYISLMLDNLNKKVSLLEKIVEINVHQKESLSDDKFDMDKFDDLVTEKGLLIEEINKLDGAFETVYERVRKELLDNTEQYSSEIASMKGLIKKITELSASIEADEKRIKVSVEKQFSKVKQAVKETRKNSKAVTNYYKNMSKIDTEPQFMDKKK